jgi:ParB family chromosome partitioning protein
MLGKGLESLIPKKKPNSDDNQAPGFSAGQNYPQEPATQNNFDKQESEIIREDRNHPIHPGEVPKISGPIFHIELEKIVFNPYQPRKEFDQNALNELAVSIREFGILQPLVVSKIEENTDQGTRVTYQLIAGQRRLMASKIAGLKTVPVVIRNFLKKAEALEMAIIENIQRQDLNTLETARAYSRLSDEFGLTQREIAARLGKSREVIANALRLLSLPTEIQEAISKGKINESHARLLLQIDDPQKQVELFERILRENLSVRDIKKSLGKEKPILDELTAPLTAEDIELKQMEKDLADFLGAPVNVEFSRSGGKIVIHFYSPEEAKGIAHRIKPEDGF